MPVGSIATASNTLSAQSQYGGAKHEVVGTAFSFYTPDEVRCMSVKELTCPQAFDNLRRPLPGGLYDPALGPTDRGNCITCGLSYGNCPGHMGHIELAVPVYHPLLFATLFRLLRAVILSLMVMYTELLCACRCSLCSLAFTMQHHEQVPCEPQ